MPVNRSVKAKKNDLKEMLEHIQGIALSLHYLERQAAAAELPELSLLIGVAALAAEEIVHSLEQGVLPSSSNHM
ncbi:MAG TPA: hypothetical protein HPP80_04745 [Rhodospirillaceae bacterium]|nr:hypothetical protein [Rhodospirillaceae bacterium]